MRVATMKWVTRARTFVARRAKKGEAAALEYGRRFRRQAKLIGAIVEVQR